MVLLHDLKLHLLDFGQMTAKEAFASHARDELGMPRLRR